MNHPTTFTARLEEHRRLVLLRLLTEGEPLPRLRRAILGILAAAPNYAANVALVADCLTDDGWRATRDDVASQFAWLARQTLTAPIDPGAPVPTVQLTVTGIEASQDLFDVPGVAPTPRAGWIIRRMTALGVAVSEGDLVQVAAFLEGHRLVRLEGERPDWLIWPIWPEAAEVARGLRVVPGIRRPSPSPLAVAGATAHALLDPGS